LQAPQLTQVQAKHPVHRHRVGAKFERQQRRQLGIGSVAEVVHDRAVRRDILGRQHGFQLVSGMHSLQHGEAGGGADIGFVRLLAVFVPDGGDDRTGNFLGKCWPHG
jgi:hypothetical protein